MARRVVTRSERRMEKKLAVNLLVLALAVSLVSFVLGVVVGKSGSRSDSAQETDPPQERLPVAQEQEPPPAQPKPKSVSPATPSTEQGPATKPPPRPKPLTFYETLPKGQQPPLGSGINLPPEEPAPETRPAPPQQTPAEPEPVPVAEVPAVPRTLPGAEPPAELPKASMGGAYVVQVASFKSPDDARSLGERLEKKGYTAFVQDADLAEKGLWHRVLVGPFADKAEAGEVLERLKAEEKLAGLVKKR